MTTSLLLALLVLPCQNPTEEPQAPAIENVQPDPAWKALGKGLWFDPKEKQLVIKARVALRDGYLEHLLCLERTKEHESILATEAPPRLIHAGLLLTGAETGHPVRFQPKFEPPTGTPIVITLQWTDKDGTLQKTNAREWVKDQQSGKTLAENWVFAGSDLFTDPTSGARSTRPIAAT